MCKPQTVETHRKCHLCQSEMSFQYTQLHFSLFYCDTCGKFYLVDENSNLVVETKNMVQEGIKNDEGKPRMDLLPYDALKEVAKVLGFGASKYTPGNWAKGLGYSRLIAAVERHIGEWKEGRDIDEESGLNHLAHAACGLLFAIWMTQHRSDMDDRWINEVKKEK